ncbi:tetratricopeptide repeat-containing sensor histidine kinase [Psychroserpens sp.]|uniref:tetratricopeptide repeat-containing sensor histidine kinase n=1 Tax=Psychroserpens sp. TaxID=2020870 RepID=UPI002B2650AA|nr:tetratricopeptide repeat protein [Psychroserpens sp.]
MNTTKDSFLFFYFIICAFILIPFCGSNAQAVKSIDSLSYYSQLAIRSKTSNDLTNTYAFFKQRSIQSLKKNDTLNVIHDLRYIAIIQYELGLIHESESTAVLALNFIDNFKINDSITNESRVGVNNHLGRVYTELRDYSSALKYCNRALQLQEDPKRLNSILNNIGFIYYKQANYQKALEVFTRVHQTNLAINNTIKVSRSLNNIGMTMSKMKLSSGLDSLLKALVLRKSVDYKKGIFDSHLKFVEYYQDRGDLINANRYAESAYELARLHGNTTLEIEALTVLMQLNPSNNVQRYTKLVDSIQEANLNVQNNYAAKKYALEKQERLVKENELKIKTIELDNEKQKRLKASYLFFGILVLLSAIFIVFYMRTKHKKERLHEVYNTESRISKKIHDEVANDVYQLMTKLEHENQIDTEIINELSSLYSRTRDISKEHGTVNSDYPFKEYLGELIENFQDCDTNIIVKGLTNISWDLLPEIHRITIYKVLQELLINMKKHSQASIVLLVFQKEKKKLNISYNDNGIGSALRKGNGLQNTENRIKSINGTIIFETEPSKGFKTKISI